VIAIRPFESTDAEYRALLAIHQAIYPEYVDTVEEWRHQDETWDPKYLFQRYLAEKDGQIVATGLLCEPWWAYKPDKYHLGILVHPDYQGQGIGGRLYDFLMEQVLNRNPQTITAQTREDKPVGIGFLSRRGFAQVQRDPISELDVTSFEADKFAPIAKRVAAQGIVIKSLAELARVDPKWKQKYYELDSEVIRDVPSPDPITLQPFEIYDEHLFGAPDFNPPSQFIALDGEEWVGMSGLWVALADPKKLYTGLTGVKRSHRRRGIAMALKLRAIAYARACGAKVIETDNEENNPMYQINLRLGFEPRPAWLLFQKRLDEAG
jgi:GNAT superfamily N-acetyltransferase